MDKIIYCFPKSLFDEIYNLSTHASLMLLQLYRFYKYIHPQNEAISFSKIRKEVFYDLDNYENILSELALSNLIKWEKTRDFYFITLECIEEKPILKIVLKKKLIQRKRKFNIDEYIDKLLSRFNNQRIKLKLKKLVYGCQKYIENTKGNVAINDLYFLISPFFSESDFIIEKTCDIYNNNIRLYGKKGMKYIHGIINNVKAEKKDNNRSISPSIEKFKREKEESDKKFSLKIVTGEVLNDSDKYSISYKSILEKNDYDKLNLLWKKGLDLIKYKDIKPQMYDWLKL